MYVCLLITQIGNPRDQSTSSYIHILITLIQHSGDGGTTAYILCM